MWTLNHISAETKRVKDSQLKTLYIFSYLQATVAAESP